MQRYNRTKVASNKSRLLLKIQMPNTQTLQLSTNNFKTENITNFITNAKLKGLGQRDLMVLLKVGGSASTLRCGGRIILMKVENVSCDQISVIDLNHCRMM